MRIVLEEIVDINPGHLDDTEHFIWVRTPSDGDGSELEHVADKLRKPLLKLRKLLDTEPAREIRIYYVFDDHVVYYWVDPNEYDERGVVIESEESEYSPEVTTETKSEIDEEKEPDSG